MKRLIMRRTVPAPELLQLCHQYRGAHTTASAETINMSTTPGRRHFRILDLPYDIAHMVVKHLKPEAQVCVALTCHQLHDLVTSSLNQPLGSICLSTRKCACNIHGWAYLLNCRHPHLDFFCLMLRLRDWMPARQSFCYFCHKYMKHQRCSMIHPKAVESFDQQSRMYLPTEAH